MQLPFNKFTNIPSANTIFFTPYHIKSHPLNENILEILNVVTYISSSQYNLFDLLPWCNKNTYRLYAFLEWYRGKKKLLNNSTWHSQMDFKRNICCIFLLFKKKILNILRLFLLYQQNHLKICLSFPFFYFSIFCVLEFFLQNVFSVRSRLTYVDETSAKTMLCFETKWKNDLKTYNQSTSFLHAPKDHN